MTIKKLLLLILLIILVTGLYYVYVKSKTGNQTPISITDVSENSSDNISSQKTINKIPYKLPSGEQVYNLSHGDKVVGPRAGKISYNPLSIVSGQPQTITVTFPQSEKVSSAIIFIDTDNLEKQKLTLQKTNDGSSNIWAGTWIPKDTINHRYRVRFYFVGSSGTYDMPTSII